MVTLPPPGAPDDVGVDGVAVVVTVDVEPAAVTGGVVLATVRSRAVRDVVLQGGEVSLGCALAYRYLEGFFGATYGATARRAVDVAAQPLPGPTLLRQGEHVDHQVLLGVPAQGLPTVNCELVQVAWTARARVRYEGTQHADAPPVPLVVGSPGRGADTDSPALLRGGRRQDHVAVAVGSRRFGPGGQVAGELVVEPARPGRLQEVRAELVFLQHVPHGPWVVDNPARNPEAHPNEAETVVARVVLAAGLPVAAGGPALRWPFELAAPRALPAPTLVTDDFALRWVLRGVAERPRSYVTTSSLELDGSTVT